MDDLIVIVGVGRSGTSLLQSMLASHSTINGIPETSFFRRYICSLKNSIRTNYSRREILSVLGADSRMKRLDVDLEKICPEQSQLSRSASHSFLKIYESILSLNRKSNDGELICDKDPKLIEFLPVVKAIPGSKIVLMIRDPRDILLSKKKAEWSSKRPPLLNILTGFIQMKLACGNKSFDKDSTIHVVVYEKLIHDPVVSLSSLCNFLDLEFEPSMLNFGVHAKHLVAADEYSWKKETLGPLLTENANKWESHLSHSEVAVIEKLSGDAFRIGGYKSSDAYSNLSFGLKFCVTIFCWTVKAVSPLITLFFRLRSLWISRNLRP